MRSRFYTLLFAILPQRLQERLWRRIGDRYGYIAFHNGTYWIGGRPLDYSDVHIAASELGLDCDL